MRCLRVERFLDFRVRRHADVREDEEEEKEVEELVRNGVKKEFSPHFRVFLNNARTRSGERRTNFLPPKRQERRKRRFLFAFGRKNQNDEFRTPPRAFFRLPFSFLSFFVFLSMYTNGLLRGRLFFGPSKRSSSLRETERHRRENTFHRGRREERSEEEEARKKKKKKKKKELLRLLRLLR